MWENKLLAINLKNKTKHCLSVRISAEEGLKAYGHLTRADTLRVLVSYEFFTD